MNLPKNKTPVHIFPPTIGAYDSRLICRKDAFGIEIEWFEIDSETKKNTNIPISIKPLDKPNIQWVWMGNRSSPGSMHVQKKWGAQPEDRLAIQYGYADSIETSSTFDLASLLESLV